MSNARISALINFVNSRELSEAEQLELNELLGKSDSEDESVGGPIGGYDLAVLNYDTVDAPVESDQSDQSDDDDDSNFEGPHADVPPMLDIHEIDAAEEQIANIDLDFAEAEVFADFIEPTEAVANRGQRYTGQGKNDKTVWWSMPTTAEFIRTCNLAKDRQLILPAVGDYPTKMDAFKKIFDNRIMETIVIETNRKAKREIAKNAALPVPKVMRPWRELKEPELYAFLGLIIHAGAEKKNLVKAKDLFAYVQHPIYRATMSLKRFEQITRFLRFDDTRTRAARLYPPMKLKTQTMKRTISLRHRLQFADAQQQQHQLQLPKDPVLGPQQSYNFLFFIKKKIRFFRIFFNIFECY